MHIIQLRASGLTLKLQLATRFQHQIYGKDIIVDYDDMFSIWDDFIKIIWSFYGFKSLALKAYVFPEVVNTYYW